MSTFLPYVEIKQLIRNPEEIPYGVDKINAMKMWNKGYKGKGIKVAVLDTGTPEHDDLNIVDAENFTNDSSDKDNQGHATHVAGTVGANGRIKGVAPEAEIYTAKVLSDKGSGANSWIAEGISWCVDKDVDIINMSLGSPMDSREIRSAVSEAHRAGIIMVAASGNSGYEHGIGYPAAYDDVIATAAIDGEKERPDFSSVGEENEIAAAGVEVVSTYLDNRYARLNGTSMASPHIAGAIALIMQEQGKLALPEIREIIHNNATHPYDKERGEYYGYGIFKL